MVGVALIVIVVGVVVIVTTFVFQIQILRSSLVRFMRGAVFKWNQFFLHFRVREEMRAANFAN